MYSAILRDHAFRPRNRREMADADAMGEAGYARCGDRLQMFFRIRDDKIEDVAFTAKACGPVVACASVASEILQGLSVAEAREVDAFQLHEALGGLPVSKRHALLLVLQCLGEALGGRDKHKL